MTPATKSFDVLAAYRQICERVAKAEHAAGRDPGSVTLVGAAKAQPIEGLRQLIDAGLAHVGENYWQDAAAHLPVDPAHRVAWHFIGPIQSNKTAAIAQHFDWVQSLDREKIAQRLSDQRPAGRPALNVLLQVNISQEDSKSGLRPDRVSAFARQVLNKPGLRLRGLMAIPAPGDNDAYPAMAALMDQLRGLTPGVDTLSLGMSADLETAIAAGATMVRIGTALFGPRPQPSST